MSYFQPPICSFAQVQDSRGDPAGAGTTITPVSGSKGSFISVGSTLTDDCYGLHLLLRAVSITNQDNTWLIDLGVDPAGGTSFNVKINNLLFEGGVQPGSVNDPWDLEFFFPLFIKAGSSIGARAQIKGATANTFGLVWRAIQKPDHPELWRTGTFVDTYGADTVNTRGTTLTNGSPDNTTYGAWTSLGSISRDAWWLQGSCGQSGPGSNNSAIVEFSCGLNPTASAPAQLMVGWLSAGSSQDIHRYNQISSFAARVRAKAGNNVSARFKQGVSNTVTMGAVAYLLG